jgi:hypothetical protein
MMLALHCVVVERALISDAAASSWERSNNAKRPVLVTYM